MKFIHFIDNRFQELRQVESQSKGILPWNDAETKALQWVLAVYRGTLKCILVPVVVTKYLLVSAGLINEPQPVLLNMLKTAEENKKKDIASLKASSPNVVDIQNPNAAATLAQSGNPDPQPA